MLGLFSHQPAQTERVSPEGSDIWTTTNPFLLNSYEPLANETQTPTLHVVGKIPQELDGALYRTGTNQHFKPLNPDQYHWFDGDGMVYAFRFRDGKASFCNKWIATDGLKVELDAGHAVYNGIYGRSGKKQTGLPIGAPPIKTVAGINVVALAGRVLTMHEADPYYWDIDPYTLETRGKYDFDGQFKSMLTAHPHYDYASQQFLFYGLENEQKYVECMAAGADGTILSRHRVEMPIAPFVHDFMFTTSYYIFMFGPMRYRPYAPETVQAGESALSFDTDSPGRVLLINRKTGAPQWFETKSFTIDHYMNAHEVGTTVVVDCAVTDTLIAGSSVHPGAYFPFPLGHETSPFSGPQLWRLVIDTASGTVKHERMGEFDAEFVKMNDRAMGRKHRFGYMAATHKPGKDTKGFNSLAKHDYETGKTAFQHLNDGYELSPGEPVFVPRNEAASEDDGWIMALWYDPHRNRSEVIILAAQDFDGEPVARVKLDHRIPPGFHGGWIPRSAHG